MRLHLVCFLLLAGCLFFTISTGIAFAWYATGFISATWLFAAIGKWVMKKREAILEKLLVDRLAEMDNLEP